MEVISRNPENDRPVFDVILRNAISFCAGDTSALLMGRKDDPRMTMAAWRDRESGSSVMDDAMIAQMNATEMLMDPSVHVSAQAIVSARNIHILDVTQLPSYVAGEPSYRIMGDALGVRSALVVPLIDAKGALGVVQVHRREVRPFSDDEISLVEAFAAQAVIAIENVRQFRELQGLLEQQKATSDILRVISQSREDELQVFGLILEKAAVLCAADQGSLMLVNDSRTHVRNAANWGQDRTSYFAGLEYSLDLPLSVVATIRTGKVVHIADYALSEAYRDRDPIAVSLVETEGVRTRLIVPLLQNGIAIGCIGLSRRVVRPFAPPEIALVETFAAQAVIAIENVRQFRELQTRLEREEATKDILEVISQSRDDDTPVFDMIAQSAARLCRAALCTFWRVEDGLIYYCASHGLDSATPAETRLAPRIPLLDTTLTGQVVKTRAVVRIEDATSESYHDHEWIRSRGMRQMVGVPIFVGDSVWGCISLIWPVALAPGDADIQLVESFAAQASIAIENVRQFRELQDRLEREKASAEILEVISQSRDDEAPVFDVILRNAARLCKAPIASLMLINTGGTHLVMAAAFGEALRTNAVGDAWAIDPPQGPVARSIRAARMVHMHDLAATDEYRNGQPTYVRLVDEDGLHTDLSVPLVRDGVGFGAILLSRRTVDPFDDADIALVETFAAQAVIAIENVRQFRELQTRLAREAATREILEVISISREDDRPVFDAILQNATWLCGADSAALLLGTPEGPHLTLAALWQWSSISREDLDRFIADINREPMQMDPDLHISARAICSGGVVHIEDLAQTDSYLSGEASFRFMVEDQGVRTTLSVPIFGTSGPIGSISVHRNRVRPYDAGEIDQVQSFAAQAVIAIENVRQFRALEALNAELGVRVQRQVAEIERMGRLKRFLPAAVADAVVTSGSDKLLSSHRALLGVLFCDIRGFTAFCETAEPEETIEVLQTYHEEMGKLIEAHGAGVDHRMGDGIMVLFNDPLPCDDPAGAALRLGMAMRDRMAELCARWKKMGHKLGFGVGIALGYATVGMVGSGGRIDYTASGTAINLASRLCDEAQDGEILLSPRARLAVEDGCALEPRGEIALKGIREPVAVFRVAGMI